VQQHLAKRRTGAQFGQQWFFSMAKTGFPWLSLFYPCSPDHWRPRPPGTGACQHLLVFFNGGISKSPWVSKHEMSRSSMTTGWGLGGTPMTKRKLDMRTWWLTSGSGDYMGITVLYPNPHGNIWAWFTRGFGYDPHVWRDAQETRRASCEDAFRSTPTANTKYILGGP
jgi:hypothetical protein